MARQVLADLQKTITKTDKQDYLEVNKSDEPFDASQNNEDLEAVLKDERDHSVEGFEPAYFVRKLDSQTVHPTYSLD